MSLDYIISQIIAECEFERLQDMNRDIPKDITYIDFCNWNKECLMHLSQEELEWVEGLCKRIPKINLVDLECCGEWQAGGIYFNMQEELCIYHPR